MDRAQGGEVFTMAVVLLKLLSARNSSILAHGLTPISEWAFRDLLGLITEAFPEIAEEVLFPKLEW